MGQAQKSRNQENVAIQHKQKGSRHSVRAVISHKGLLDARGSKVEEVSRWGGNRQMILLSGTLKNKVNSSYLGSLFISNTGR